MKQILACINRFRGLKKSVRERIFAFFLFVLGIVSICIAANVRNADVAVFFGLVFLFCLFAVTYYRSKSMEEDFEKSENDSFLAKPSPGDKQASEGDRDDKNGSDKR